MKHLLGFLLVCSGFATNAQVPPYVTEGFDAGSTGWYFITTLQFQGSNNAMSQALILDGAGDVVFRQRVPSVSNFRVWPDGRMSYAARGKHLLMDGTFTLVDSLSCVNGRLTDLHDLRILPNGNYLLLGTENRTMDLSGYQVFQNGTVAGSPVAVVKSAIIQELDVDRNLLWEWNALDHFDFLDTDTSRLNNPNVVDWTHSNALELDTDGNILLSSRHFNEITKIDRNDGSIIWRMGGVRNEFTFINDPGFFLQHDIRRLPNGNITLFDNSKAGAHPGRGVEYTIDETAMTATPTWSASYDEGAYSKAMGSMQRLPNGNTVIGWGALSPDNAMFTVHGPDGERISRLTFLDTSITYRAYYFDELPFLIDRPEITCNAVGDDFELTANTQSNSYLWSTGATGPSITVGALDTVHVEVPVGSGAFLRSAPFTPDVHCSGTSIGEVDMRSFRIHPNPATSHIWVDRASGVGAVPLEILDAIGNVVRTATINGERATVQVHDLQPGVYFVRVGSQIQRFVRVQ